MTIKLTDMDKVDAWTSNVGAMLPVGDHVVRIESVLEGESSNRNPQIELELEGPAGSIRDWIVVLPQTRGKVKQLLDAAGIEVESGEWEFEPQVLAGRPVQVTVGEEPDNRDPSKTRRRVQAYSVPPEDAGAPATNGAAAQSDDSDLPF